MTPAGRWPRIRPVRTWPRLGAVACLVGIVATLAAGPARADEPVDPGPGASSPAPVEPTAPPDPTVPATPAAPADPAADAAPDAAAPDAVTPEVPSRPQRLVIGRSLEGRDLVAVGAGDPAASRVLLVLGQMHGDEPAGRRVVQRLRAMAVPEGMQVWTVETMNPDGARRGTRGNARGIDLNRNFPYGWRPTATSSLYAPGSARASEPETQALLGLLRRIDPDAVVSFHQAFNAVDVSLPKTAVYARRLARWIGLRTVRVPCRGPCAGTMTGWVNARLPGLAITVELPGRVPTALVRRSADAALRLGAAVPDAATGQDPRGRLR